MRPSDQARTAPESRRWEADDFAHLPEMAFVRGFVAQLCKILQLDPQPLLAMLPQAMRQEPAAGDAVFGRGAIPECAFSTGTESGLAGRRAVLVGAGGRVCRFGITPRRAASLSQRRFARSRWRLRCLLRRMSLLLQMWQKTAVSAPAVAEPEASEPTPPVKPVTPAPVQPVTPSKPVAGRTACRDRCD